MVDDLRHVILRACWPRSPGVINLTALMLIVSMLTGCAVGPDYHPPAPPAGDRFTSAPMPSETAVSPGDAGAAQHFVLGQDIPGEWWSLFHCAPLNALMRDALANSPNLAAAWAALRQAKEDVNAEVGNALYPHVDANLGVSRSKAAGLAFGQEDLSPLTLYNASVSVSYSFDLFGGARRELEALRAQVDYQRFQLEAVYLALTANLVTASVREASLRAQIEATEQVASYQQAQLDLVMRQFELGGASRPAVLAQRSLLAQTRASLPALRQSLDQVRHQMAVLAGKPPSDASLPQFKLSDFSLPRTLPVSLPSTLVRQRPDILAADALLHQASAKVGVATAAMYPQLTLTGSYGGEALTPAGVFKPASSIWSLGTNLLQPLFHGGQLSAQKRAAVAAYDQAAAQYRETVLLAFQNVADTLRALDADAHALTAQSDAWLSARDTLALSQQQYRLGALSYLALLDAQRQYQQSTVNLVQAQAARYADTAALFQALGGGWWTAPQSPEAKAGKPEAPMGSP
ncbi:efflux transporter outer membrane subunit [Crenobacter sp. SG2303]|uniref:Efflux transporter outer membrane subunit n=1 Tax=Crenobacter oryzisoli TaxID=3056844 RepID=A0ABT7XIN8_9NEIS|nr:efflux transporter outer membrane subunit [Crenobacter sp. SG2303]MDN0073631.1 efflux transporter outer membrane subunit [Crenobacter sp. SG2303]